jgi:hypothetical protein
MKSAEDRDLFPGALEMMILQTLKRAPMHGYALAKHIKQSSDHLLQIEEGSLYPALQRMLKEGWVEARDSLAQPCAKCSGIDMMRKFIGGTASRAADAYLWVSQHHESI